MTPALSQITASKLLARLVAAGVTDYLLAPGSRSQPLAVAAAQLERAGLARILVRLDERSLAFTALGLAAANQRVVAVITTSGSAVANLHPAVLEAHHAGRPLLLLTADRPHELRGVGANQTTNQVGIFADAVRHCFDIPAAASEQEAEAIAAIADRAMALATGRAGERPGPVQLNLAFREPLSADLPDAAVEFDLLRDAVDPGQAAISTEAFQSGENLGISGQVLGCVIAGSNAGVQAIEFASAVGWPLFAEPASLARAGANMVARYADILRVGLSSAEDRAAVELVQQIRQVVVFGRPTLNRVVNDLLARESVSVTVVRDHLSGGFDPTRRVERFVDSVSASDTAAEGWLESWLSVSGDFPASEFDLARRDLVSAVFAATRADGRALLLGASDLIRQADRWAPDCFGMPIFANRGVSGIDGTIASAQGIALSNGFSGVRVLMGDLTFVHDLASLNQSALPALNIQLVVGNDLGGRIFQKLRIADSLGEGEFEKLFLTPQSLDLAQLARSFGWNYAAPDTLSELVDAMKQLGPWVIDYRLPI